MFSLHHFDFCIVILCTPLHLQVGKDSSTEKLISKLKTWYLDQESECTQSCSYLHVLAPIAQCNLMLDTVMTPVISACVHSLYCPVQCHSGESKQRAGSVKMAHVWMQGRDWHYHSCFPYAAAVVSKSAQCMLVLAACANNQTGVKCCSSTRVDGHPEWLLDRMPVCGQKY